MPAVGPVPAGAVESGRLAARFAGGWEVIVPDRPAWGELGAAATPLGSAVRGARVVVLVEGVSDQVAVEGLAVRRGRDLAVDGVRVLPMGGATNVGHHLRALGRLGVPASGLLDVGEERFVRRGLASAGLGTPATRAELARAGFYLCVADLEDELIRSLGVPATEDVLAANGDLELFRRFQRQPAQRVRPVSHQLHRFLGTTSGRKARYAGLLVEHLDLDRVPEPLDALLEYVSA